MVYKPVGEKLLVLYPEFLAHAVVLLPEVAVFENQIHCLLTILSQKMFTFLINITVLNAYNILHNRVSLLKYLSRRKQLIACENTVFTIQYMMLGIYPSKMVSKNSAHYM